MKTQNGNARFPLVAGAAIRRIGRMRWKTLGFMALAVILTGGCDRRPKQADEVGHGHQHQAPHGGQLIEVGRHQFNIELVHDPVAGTLTLYTLDAHAENFVRTAMASITVLVQVAGQDHTLTLRPVANTATGETVGATSQYEAQAAWLQGVNDLTGTLTLLDFNGVEFRGIAFGP